MIRTQAGVCIFGGDRFKKAELMCLAESTPVDHLLLVIGDKDRKEFVQVVLPQLRDLGE